MEPLGGSHPSYAFETDDRFQALKLIREWSTWMVTVEAALVAFLANAVDRSRFALDRGYVIAAVVLFCVSITLAAWVLGSLPSITQRLRGKPRTPLGAFGFLDLPLLRCVPLYALTALQHTFFFLGLIALVAAFFATDAYAVTRPASAHAGGGTSMSNEVAALWGAAVGGFVAIIGTVITQMWVAKWRREDQDETKRKERLDAQLHHYGEAIYYAFKLGVSAAAEDLLQKDVRQHASALQRHLALLEAYAPATETTEIQRIAASIENTITADIGNKPARQTSAAALQAAKDLKSSFKSAKLVAA